MTVVAVPSVSVGIRTKKGLIMPEFKTTAKGADAPFVKRTAGTVETVAGEFVVYFTKGEGDKGWRAFASPSLDSANASGKTLDGAVIALRDHLTDVAEADSMGSDAPAEITPDAPAEITPDAPAEIAEPVKVDETETETEEAPEIAPESVKVPDAMTGSKAAALILSSVTSARDAYTSGQTDANDVAMVACKTVAELCETAKTSGADAARVARLYDYGTKLAEHYYGKTGGGNSVLTDAQRSRAWKKLNKVCRELATT